MPTDTIGPDNQKALIQFPAICRKLKRIGPLTDVLVAAATDVNDLIADAYAALRSGTIELYGPEVLALVRRFEQQIKLMQKLGLITDVLAAALTTVQGVDAATDLSYLVRGVITISYSATSEDSPALDGPFSYAVTR